jgi:branched-subunit amino acid aminotransferase/4-amino-4-deoxychorismate lyase
MNPHRCELNGQRASAEDLRHPLLTNYGHFTSMQVRDGCVQGLDLHLERLARATLELFGHDLDPVQTRDWMRHALAGTPTAATLRVNVFARALDRRQLDRPVEPDVLVTTSAASLAAPPPPRVGSARYRRDAPHIKHVGTFGLFLHKRLAQAAGYDDALFVDADGAVAEGSIWNVGFVEDDGFVWPDAPALAGISMQLLKSGLAANGVASVTRRVDLAEIGGFRGAFFTNSAHAVLPLAAIDAVTFEPGAGWTAALEAALQCHPWQRI